MSEQKTTTYSHRAKPYAQEAEFRLMPQHLAIEQGKRSGDFAYRDIVMIRLMYKPRNTTNEGYQAKLYRRDKRTAALTNLSWKSLVDMDRQDGDYRRFMIALVAKVHGVNPNVVLEAGMPRWLHIITAIAGIVAVLAMIVVTAQAMLNGVYAAAVITGILALYFGWWSIRYLTRNRPRPFTADAIPDDVLPKDDAK
jgi:hypothetical protein